MEGIIYQNNHNIPKDMIIFLLKSINCSEIKDNHYEHDGYGVEKSSGKIPDFICNYNGKKTAVEVGTLSNSYQYSNKIQFLLDEFDFVIHIFADKKVYLLHCAIYEKDYLTSQRLLNVLEEKLKSIKNEEISINNLIREIKKEDTKEY